MRNDSIQTHGSAANMAADNINAQTRSLKMRAVDEVKKFLIITLYLWVLFALFSLYRTIVLEEEHINYQAQGFAIVNALVFAKVMLVADGLKLGSRFSDRPLIYSVLFRAAAFTVVLICFHIIEEAALAWLHGNPLADSLADFGSRILKGILSVGAIMFVTLIPYFTFTEIGRVIGSDKLWELLLARDRRTVTLLVRE